MVRNCAPLSMEATLYEEQLYHRLNDMDQMKRSFTLDLNPARNQAKKMKFNPVNSAAPVLSSPDINMLKLASPELEKIIMQNGIVSSTPTPTTQILFPKTVTEEQEMYARGFVEALNVLHNNDSSQGSLQQLDVPATTGNGGMTYMNLDQTTNSSFGLPTNFLENGVLIKDEPQTVPSLENTPPMSPIDMETQEKIKLERKRQRNRVAASKCRRRKLERISRLEDKVKQLKGENTELTTVVNKLKEHVCHLKEQVMEHVEAGCQIVIAPHFWDCLGGRLVLFCDWNARSADRWMCFEGQPRFRKWLPIAIQ